MKAFYSLACVIVVIVAADAAATRGGLYTKHFDFEIHFTNVIY